jgi:hypothetical protein
MVATLGAKNPVTEATGFLRLDSLAYFGGVSLVEGCAFGPVVALGGAAGDPLALPRSGPLPGATPVVPGPVVPPLIVVVAFAGPPVCGVCVVCWA